MYSCTLFIYCYLIIQCTLLEDKSDVTKTCSLPRVASTIERAFTSKTCYYKIRVRVKGTERDITVKIV